MPDLRALLVAVGVGVGVAAYTLLWWHWPLAFGVGAGILLGGLALTGTISIGGDAAAADAAWRTAAPDLQDGPANRSSDVAVGRVGTARGRDLPSGD